MTEKRQRTAAEISEILAEIGGESWTLYEVGETEAGSLVGRSAEDGMELPLELLWEIAMAPTESPDEPE